jgi:cell division protease FtsH
MMVKTIFFLLPVCYSFNLNSFNKPIRRNKVLKASLNDLPSKVLNEVTRNGYGTEWSYSDFLENLKKKNIDGVSLFSNGKGMGVIDSNHGNDILPENIHIVKTISPMVEDLIPKLNSQHVNFDIFQVFEQTNSGFSLLGPLQFIGIYVVGSIVISAIINAFRNGGGQGPGNGQNFMNPMDVLGKNKDIVDPKAIDVRFTDVAGCDEAKFELMEVVDYLKDPKKYEVAGAKIPRGVLLEGEPGTGKTLLARAVAGEAGVSFMSASGSEFIEMYVGVGASRVRKLFETAQKNSPCVIFIDEIDAVGRQRGAGVNSGNDEREQTLNQILTNMDGFEKMSGIIVLAATNRADILDSALLRPGRFDRKVKVPLPDIEGRKDIFKVHLKNKKISDEVDIDELASLTTGFSGADICNLANEAAILSVRNNQTEIDRQIMLNAYEKVTIGLPSSKEIRDKYILELVSYHEIGHALTAKYFEEFFDLRKVTINANQGGAGGYTLFTPKERFNSYPTKKFMLANLVVAMGGRAAEVVLYSNKKSSKTDIVFSDIDNLEITTGASNDLKQANNIARRYVSIFGASNDLSISTDTDNTKPFLGRELGLGGDKSSEYAKEKTDKMVAELINDAYKIALNLIKFNIEDFNKLSKKLLENRNLSGSDFDDIFLKYYK